MRDIWKRKKGNLRMYKDKNFYLNLFQVSEAQLERLAADGLGGGGSYCDLFFENTSYNNLFLRDGIVSSGGFHIDYGVGIRVLKGDKTGYAYSESTPADMTGDPATQDRSYLGWRGWKGRSGQGIQE